ncbi:hypothetical protein [Marinobacter gelidimuriae]|uniref:hypothetical protein n=1 Tax=Marinobacter gelidimuriae TaxID=2739064 RepID=UPI0003628E10|nr:hypothetical protein [Marinobacter gelidimuriae]
MTTATYTYNPALGSPDQIMQAQMPISQTQNIERFYEPADLDIDAEKLYRSTQLNRSRFSDHIQSNTRFASSQTRALYKLGSRSIFDFQEARSMVAALKSVATVNDPKKAALYLAQNSDVGQLALLAATTARYADNVERVVVEIVEDPESGNENLFVTAVVATEDFDVWDAIDEHVLSNVMEPSASINLARVVFSISHAESL